MKAKWLYCQGCEEVMEAVDGYFLGDSHSCLNSGTHTGKIPKLLKLTATRVRKEIEECREEVANINCHIGDLLWYERELRHGSKA
jgi:hypothetical protein